MAREQDVVKLPFQLTEFNEDMLPLLNRNFKEIERMLSILQMYMKQTGKPVDQTVQDNQGTWNRAGNINPDGTFPTAKLTDKVVGLQHELQLADQAVTEAKVAVGAIKTPHLGDGCVTNIKLAAGAVTEAKLNWQTHVLY